MLEQRSVRREVIGTGENLLVQADGAGALPELDALAGQVQCVYLDPPFMTGERFVRRRRYGAEGWRTGDPAPAYEAYADAFASREEYAAMLTGLLRNAHRLLSSTGVMYLHLDWRANALARLVCDEVFGEKQFLNEIIWAYESGGRAKRYFSRKHDTILLYARSRRYRFDVTRVPLRRETARSNHMRRTVDEQGRACRTIRSGGKLYRYYDDAPTYPSDVWTDISHLQQRDPERTGYATQKPVKLLERLLRPVTRPGDWVCDLCCGSGTTLAAAQSLGCRFAGVDAQPEAVLIARNRVRADSLTLIGDCCMEPALVDAAFDPATGMVLLTGVEASHPAFPAGGQAMDSLESWAAGRLRDGVFEAAHAFHRSHRHPELPPMCLLPPGPGQATISTVDAAGRRRVYCMTEEEKQ